MSQDITHVSTLYSQRKGGEFRVLLELPQRSTQHLQHSGRETLLKTKSDKVFQKFWTVEKHVNPTVGKMGKSSTSLGLPKLS